MRTERQQKAVPSFALEKFIVARAIQGLIDRRFFHLDLKTRVFQAVQCVLVDRGLEKPPLQPNEPSIQINVQHSLVSYADDQGVCGD